MKLILIMSILVLVTGRGDARADTHIVLPDGTGDFPTIQAGIDGSVAGDTIELGEGVYTGEGNRDINIPDRTITIRSATGQPESCIIDCQASATDPHRGFIISEGGLLQTSVLEGVTVMGGWAPDEDPAPSAGGGVLVFITSPRFVSCIFRDNHAGDKGGGIYFRGGTQSLSDCVFLNNSAEFGGGWYGCWSAAELDECTFTGNVATAGGALGCDGWLVLTRCLFRQNNAQLEGSGGAVAYIGDYLEVADCTFSANTAGRGSALWAGVGAGSIRGCTFTGNCASEGNAILVWTNVPYAVESCLIAFGTGSPIAIDGIAPLLSCCNIWGNEGGDWVGCIADQLGQDGNICLDPQFCSPDPDGHENWSIQSDSPCAPFSEPNEECDLIGAMPVGCGSTPAQETSWGKIKALYRE